MFSLFSRLQELVGVELTTDAKQELRDFPDSFEFVSSDVLDVYAKVKHLNIIDYAGTLLYCIISFHIFCVTCSIRGYGAIVYGQEDRW
jgi:hypothetical protein